MHCKNTAIATIHHALSAKSHGLKVKVSTADGWLWIAALLDSGANITLGGYNQLRELINNYHPFEPGTRTVVTAGGAEFGIRGEGLINLRLTLPNSKPLHLLNVWVGLIDSPLWSSLLIGEDLLAALKLMPGQNLEQYVGATINLSREKTEKLAVEIVSDVDDNETVSNRINSEFNNSVINDDISLDGSAEQIIALHYLEAREDADECACNDCEKIRVATREAPVGYGDKIEQLGYSDENEVRDIISKQLNDAVLNKILNDVKAGKYLELLNKKLSAFGTRNSLTQLSTLPGMKIRLKRKIEVDAPPKTDRPGKRCLA